MGDAAAPRLSVSVSAVQAFRECEQRYHYQYIQGVVRSVQAPRLDLGSWLHRYLEGYYLAIQQGVPANEAHLSSLKPIYAVAKAQATEFAMTAQVMGDEQTALDYHGLPDKLRRLAVGYYRVRGRQDPELYDILHVEAKVNAELSGTIDQLGYVDLVTRRRRDGLIGIWEHKSHERIPTQGYRLRNLQVAVYAYFLEQTYDLRPDYVLWNYLCTKEPESPKVLKSGEGLSRAQIHSTWSVYREALDRYGFDPADYIEQQIALSGRELTHFYPRAEVSLPAGPSIVVRDYLRSAAQIEAARSGWKGGEILPVRNVTTGCDYCSYLPLCEQAILTGDEPDPRTHGYLKKPRREDP